jgi:hypothetical protein
MSEHGHCPNCNADLDVEGDFDQLVVLLGERVDVK